MANVFHSWRGLVLSIGVACLVPVSPATARQEPSLPGLPPVLRTPAANAFAREQESSAGDRGQDAQTPKSDEQVGSDDRLFWTLPNFLTVESAEHVPPLTTKQKFDVTTRSTFDMAEYPWYAALAAIGQAQGAEPTYGRGAAGYAKRYGLAFVDGTVENYMVNAIAASALHQDPRYYQLGSGTAWHRAGYAIGRLFVTRSDAGRRQFNFSEMLGAATAAGLADTYHPAGDRTVANTVATWWTQMGYDALSFTLKEFWPDIRRKLQRH
jgi:hypothetical protein